MDAFRAILLPEILRKTVLAKILQTTKKGLKYAMAVMILYI